MPGFIPQYSQGNEKGDIVIKGIFRNREIVSVLLMVFLAVLSAACEGAGHFGGGGAPPPPQTPLDLGSWTGNGISFNLNEGSYWIEDLSVTYSGHATGTICSYDYTITQKIDTRIPVENNTFIYESTELTIEGLFVSNTSAEVEVTWSHYNQHCDAIEDGTDILFADHTTVSDDHGDDPSSATALETDGTKVGGEIQAKASGDLDFFSFDATAGNTYIIETSDLEAGLDTLIVLYGTNGTTQIDEDDDGGDEASGSKIEWTCQESGTYYVSVESYLGASTGSYNFAVGSDGPTLTVAGEWSGTSGFGEIELVVALDSIEIESIVITFNDFNCVM
jgi:hypothetical protein